MKQFKVFTASNGSDTEAVTVSDSVWYQDLLADTPITIAVPANANMALFQFTGVGPLYARFGGAQMVTEPASGFIDDMVMNPYGRIIEDDVTEIHLIAGTAGRVSVEFFR